MDVERLPIAPKPQRSPSKRSSGGVARRIDRASSWLASLIVHGVLVLVLALVTVAVGTKQDAHLITLSARGEMESLDPLPVTPEIGGLQLDSALEELDVLDHAALEPPRVTLLPRTSTSDPAAESSVGEAIPESNDTRPTFGASAGGSLAGRSEPLKSQLAAKRGASAESERAVERGLRWLVAHQHPDGSWRFDHFGPQCYGQCRNVGDVSTTTGATAMALLCFLGAGQTHVMGEHSEAVKSGLYYLESRMLTTPHGGDFQEGTMYAQGLAGIALAEAFAMTDDRAIGETAQQALDFVVYAQDQKGGGWRYTPGEPGDTTVTGWQLMALVSGEAAGLRVYRDPFELAGRFLDGVESESGARYGYRDRKAKPTTSAVGLLCRMYLGWHHDHPALERGVAHLCQFGPADNDMYFNYYATQVVSHYGGPRWEKWNPAMRDFLVVTQANEGHESGSWYFEGGFGDKGGRLYNTCMAVMTLEVYYRYLPLYTEVVVEEDD